VFFNVIREPISFGGGLEHSASQFDIMPQGAFADPLGNFGDFMVPLMSHEYFHLFNVKRIRPAEMWPYDYHAEQYTPLLWWSEGVTDYYADLTTSAPVCGARTSSWAMPRRTCSKSSPPRSRGARRTAAWPLGSTKSS